MSSYTRKRGPKASPDRFHPIPIGTTVAVIRLPAGTAPYIEGLAIIKEIAPSHDHYWVGFLGEEPILRERTVHGALQRNPAQILAALRDVWDFDLMESPAVADFFPDDFV